METGLIKRTEIASGVITAGTLTVLRGGACLTSIVNVNEEELEITLPTVELE
jgi:hypothetical protein